MGTRIAVMHQGLLQQVDTPQAVYDRPANTFVATFIGSPPMNLIRGEIDAGGSRFAAEGVTVALPSGAVTGPRPVLLGIRPEHLRPTAGEPDSSVSGTVDVVEPLGSDLLVTLRAGAGAQIARVEPHLTLAAGDAIRLAVSAERACLFDVETGVRLPIEQREPIARA